MTMTANAETSNASLPAKKVASKSAKTEPKKGKVKASERAVKDADVKIKLLVKNPHPKGTINYDQFAILAGLRPEARTIGKALDAKLIRNYLRYAENCGHIKLER